MLINETELDERLDDIDAQLRRLFSFHGQNWESIKRQAAENRPQPPTPFHHDARWGTNKP
jgi:hypothetical protein